MVGQQGVGDVTGYINVCHAVGVPCLMFKLKLLKRALLLACVSVLCLRSVHHVHAHSIQILSPLQGALRPLGSEVALGVGHLGLEVEIADQVNFMLLSTPIVLVQWMCRPCRRVAFVLFLLVWLLCLSDLTKFVTDGLRWQHICSSSSALLVSHTVGISHLGDCTEHGAVHVIVGGPINPCQRHL